MVVTGAVINVAVIAGVTGAVVDAVGTERSSSASAVVTYLVDGDTFDARIDGDVVRIRMLNIDTPETKDPRVGVECLGPEAAEHLAELIPVGTSVRLAYDVERTDRYGRTLAGVFADDRFINAEMAAAGLAVPVVVGENDRFYPEVRAASKRALDEDRGFFSDDAECTLPAKVEALSDSVEQAPAAAAQPVGASAAELETAAVEAEAVVALARRLLSDVLGGDEEPAWAVLGDTDRDRLADQVRTLLHEAQAKVDGLRVSAGKARDREEAEAKAREAAAERQQAEEARAAEQARREAAERDAAERRAPPPPPRNRSESEPRTDSASSSGSSNPYPGYTGPRCYAPGGKTWKPC